MRNRTGGGSRWAGDGRLRVKRCCGQCQKRSRKKRDCPTSYRRRFRYSSTGTSSERHMYQLATEQYGCHDFAMRSIVLGLGMTFIP